MENHSSRRISVRSYLVDIVLLALLCGLFFWRDLTPVAADRWSFAEGDFTGQFYAFARYEATRLQSGQLPLWNPYVYGGHPFLADIQSAVFYPPSLLTILLTAAKGFSYRALEIEAIAHFFLAALFTYLLVRRLTRSRIGGLTGAVLFTFSGYLTSYPPLQLAILETMIWLPLILFLLEIGAERLEAGAPWAASRWAVGAGLAFGVSLLAGHPQSGLFVGYAGLAYGLFRFWPRKRVVATDGSDASRDGFTGFLHNWRWPIALLLMFGLVGLGTAAVQLLPSWQFTRLSTRSSLGFGEAGTGLTPYDLLQPILPALGGNVPALYVGVTALGLAVLALTAVRRDRNQPSAFRRMIAFLGWTLLVSLLLSFGKNVGFYSLAYLLAPGWRLFRGQERVIVWAVLAVALLAGYGIAWLSKSWAAMRSDPNDAQTAGAAGEGGRRWLAAPEGGLVLAFGLGAAGAFLLALIFFVGYQSGHDNLWGFTAASMTLAIFLLLSMVALRSRKPYLLVAVIVLDLFTYNPRLHAGPSGQVDLQPYRTLLSIPLEDQSIFRLSNEDSLPGNYGLLYDLEDIRGASPMQLASYEQWMQNLPLARVWRLLNVKYVVTWRQFLEVPARRLAEAPGQDPQHKPIYLYLLEDSGPRAWLAGEAIAEPDIEGTLRRLSSDAFDPDRQVLLTSIPDGFGASAACDGDIAWRDRQPERLILEVSTAQPCILVLGELVYPGWQASVDGQPTPILLADGVLRAVTLQPGTHQVNFAFRPASVLWGAVISLLTLALAVAWLALSPRTRRAGHRSRRGDQEPGAAIHG
jgi:hypothetical protein